MKVHRARQLVTQRSQGACEICDHARATDWHHRQARSQGGTWAPSNGLHLCRDCHRMVTEQPDAARRWGWVVPQWQNPAEVAARLLHLGWVYLDDQGNHQEVPSCREP